MKVALLTVSIAAVASATPQSQAPPAPAAGAQAVRVLPVQRSVYMLAGPEGNVALQVGADGVLLVDTQTAALAPQVIAAVRTLTDEPIHTIIDTHVHPDHTGGNDALVKLRGQGATQPVRIIAHEAVLRRMTAAAASANAPLGGLRVNAVVTLPVTRAYFTPSMDFFLNGEAVVIYHAPAAHTDGDSIVHFRGSDVLAVGDLFRPDEYPFIDTQNGGSVEGLVAALNRILDLAVPAKYQEGGTYIIPGHGRLCDEAEVVEYRDMVTIVRDRVRDLIGKGMTLDQVKTARPSRDYDSEYGGAGNAAPDTFVEAVFRSLKR
jgi:glyoxylase-like metal-dependent hydrolase (beta-lactamase superfamily II)